MRKVLHIALVALFSTLTLGAYAQETVLWEENWQSSAEKTLVNEVQNPNAVYTINTEGGAAPKFTKLYYKTGSTENLELLLPKKGNKETWTATINDLKGKSGDLTLTFAYNKDGLEITSSTAGVTITEVSKTGAKINVPEGTANLVLTFKNTITFNGRIDDIKLVAGAAEEVYPEVANIAALKALGVGAKAILTLTDAHVNFANGKDVFIEDATGAINFYDCGLTYTAGQKLNGTIKVKEYKLYYKLPEVTVIADNNLVATEGEVTPNEVSIESVSEAMACKLVKVSGKVTTAEEEYQDKNGETKKRTNYFLEDEDQNTVQFYRKWEKLEGTDISTLVAGDNATVTGIVVFKKNVPVVAVTAFEKNGTNSISDISAEYDNNAPVYNIAGQRVEKAVKGIYIRNGKKYVLK